jgi:hypothetical protein
MDPFWYKDVEQVIMVLISLLVLKQRMNVDRLNCDGFIEQRPNIEYML